MRRRPGAIRGFRRLATALTQRETTSPPFQEQRTGSQSHAAAAMSCRTLRRPRRVLGTTCGKDRFPKSSLLKRRLQLTTRLSLDKKPQTCAPLNEDHSFGYSTKVLIHGWQRRRLQVVPQLERLSIQASRNKCVVSLVKSAVHVALPAFAAQRRAAALLLLDARHCRSMSPACTALSSKPAARRCCGRMVGQTGGRTDRQTNARPLYRPCFAYYAGSANKQRHTAEALQYEASNVHIRPGQVLPPLSQSE